MLTLPYILASFGGGVFATLIGALPAFIFCGVVGLVGIAISASGGPTTLLDIGGFGAFFGPHIAFAAAVVAAGYAGNKSKTLDSGMDILTPIAKTNDVGAIIVGGIFGVLAHLIQQFWAGIHLPTDTIGFTVFTLHIIGRLVFGSTGLLSNKGPAALAEGEKRPSAFPDAKSFIFGIVWSFSLGLVISYLIDLTQIAVLGFCISAVTLFFLQMGFPVPTSHHVTLLAGYATLATGNIYIGAVFAAFTWLVGDIINRFFNTRGDTFVDPPGAAIGLVSFIVFIFLQ